MLSADKVFINDVDISVTGIKPKERMPVPSPIEETDPLEILGRNGSLTRKKGYKDINYPIKFYIHDKPFKKGFRLAKPHIYKAKTLSFSEDEDVYYKVKSLIISASESILNSHGEFTVDFTLDPFQYEKENKKINVVSGMNLLNNGHESLPIINVTASGNCQMWINEQTFRLTNLNGTITINCEQKNAYRNMNGLLDNLNGHMIGGFPKLEEGKNIIKFTGDISKVEVIPNFRWK